MIYPQVSPNEWARIYNIEPKKVPCRKCGKIQDVSTPFATDDARGFIAELHECGEGYQSFRCTFTSNETRELLSEIVDLFSSVEDKTV